MLKCSEKGHNFLQRYRKARNSHSCKKAKPRFLEAFSSSHDFFIVGGRKKQRVCAQIPGVHPARAFLWLLRPTAVSAPHPRFLRWISSSSQKPCGTAVSDRARSPQRIGKRKWLKRRDAVAHPSVMKEAPLRPDVRTEHPHPGRPGRAVPLSKL